MLLSLHVSVTVGVNIRTTQQVSVYYSRWQWQRQGNYPRVCLLFQMTMTVSWQLKRCLFTVLQDGPEKTDTFYFVINFTNVAVFPRFFLPVVGHRYKFLLWKAFSKCPLFSSLVLVINNMFDPSPSLLDHGCHPNIKIVHNSLQNVSWNSPYFSPDVFLQSLDCVRVVLVDSLLQVTPEEVVGVGVEVGGIWRPRVVRPPRN